MSVISYTGVKQYIFLVEWYLMDLCVFHLTIYLMRVFLSDIPYQTIFNSWIRASVPRVIAGTGIRK